MEGIFSMIALAFSTAALSSSHTAHTVPLAAAFSAEPLLLALGAAYRLASFAITTKSAASASSAAVPEHTPATTAIWGTTPEILEVHSISSP